VAERLRDCVGPEAFLARLGGDEFAVLQRDLLEEEAGEMADHIVDALLAPVTPEWQARSWRAAASASRWRPENGTDPGDPDEECRARALSRQGTGPRLRTLLRSRHG
jgi:GGDEF domain-containing protein